MSTNRKGDFILLKWSIPIMALLLFTACTFDSAAAEKLVTQIGDIVDERNAIYLENEKPNKLDQAISALETKMQVGKPNQALVQAVTTELEKVKQERERKKQKLEKIRANALALKKQMDSLSNERREMAINAVDQFIALLDKEIALSMDRITMDQQDIIYYTVIGKGKKPPEDNYEELAMKVNETQEEINRLLSQFNQSWNDFHKNVTGQETEQVQKRILKSAQ